MTYIYGSFAGVNRYKLPLLLSLVLAGTCGISTAAASDYDFNLHTYPNPFIAGGQYGTRYAMVVFNVPSGGTASLYVYDLEGVLIRTLVEGKRYAAGDYEESWNGRDDKNNLVGPGPYVIVLELEIQGQSYRDTFVAVAHR